MEPDNFIAEVYRRMGSRMQGGPGVIDAHTFNALATPQAIAFYDATLPKDRDVKIVDIGSGGGEFLAACQALGFTNINAFYFRAEDKFRLVCEKFKNIKAHNFSDSIGSHFGKSREKYDVIHFSHIIEHIPKYSLIYTLDALYKSLNKDGLIIIRTPNMEGPAALSSFYVTLAHEYGFVGSNLVSLLSICNFDDIALVSDEKFINGIKQKIGRAIRFPIISWQKCKHRLFGVNTGGNFGSELIVTARRRNMPELFDEKFL